MTFRRSVIVSLVAGAGLAGSALAQPVLFSTNGPDLKMGAASRPGSDEAKEIEAADDFLLSADTRLTSATVQGLIPAGTALRDIREVAVEIYRVFPLDSDLTRTQRVPTRNNSPSDKAFEVRDSATRGLRFEAQVLERSVTVGNTVVKGIRPSPDQTTQGEGPATGQRVEITAKFDVPIDLPPGHYFFVPQVKLGSGDFLWLSAPKPIVAPGTPFLGDLQAWIRNADLDPDWLRIGADIVGGSPAPAFNMVLQLTGATLCYANCDGSTAAPVLNVNDFTCFLDQYAKGDPHANCDQSTAAPVLNVLDFACFLNRFAAGCP